MLSRTEEKPRLRFARLFFRFCPEARHNVSYFPCFMPESLCIVLFSIYQGACLLLQAVHHGYGLFFLSLFQQQSVLQTRCLLLQGPPPKDQLCSLSLQTQFQHLILYGLQLLHIPDFLWLLPLKALRRKHLPRMATS